MKLSISVEDRNWLGLRNLEGLAANAVAAASKAARHRGKGEVSLLFTGDAEIARLNGKWRGKHEPTNVLSFPAAGSPAAQEGNKPLGDIALAFGTVSREADAQGKTLKDHAIHLIIHGYLHLLGYDHMAQGEAKDMERLEARILKELGIPDPYE